MKEWPTETLPTSAKPTASSHNAVMVSLIEVSNATQLSQPTQLCATPDANSFAETDSSMLGKNAIMELPTLTFCLVLVFAEPIANSPSAVTTLLMLVSCVTMALTPSPQTPADLAALSQLAATELPTSARTAITDSSTMSSVFALQLAASLAEMV